MHIIGAVKSPFGAGIKCGLDYKPATCFGTYKKAVGLIFDHGLAIWARRFTFLDGICNCNGITLSLLVVFNCIPHFIDFGASKLASASSWGFMSSFSMFHYCYCVEFCRKVVQLLLQSALALFLRS